MGFAPARVYQKALFDAGIPATAFTGDDSQAEYARLQKLGGVSFATDAHGAGDAAAFDDTCGNLIQIVQPQIVQPIQRQP